MGSTGSLEKTKRQDDEFNLYGRARWIRANLVLKTCLGRKQDQATKRRRRKEYIALENTRDKPGPINSEETEVPEDGSRPG